MVLAKRVVFPIAHRLRARQKLSDEAVVVPGSVESGLVLIIFVIGKHRGEQGGSIAHIARFRVQQLVGDCKCTNGKT